MCSVPADWSLPAEACEWLYLIMQLPSDRIDWTWSAALSPASDGDCNLIRPIKKSFVQFDTLTEQNWEGKEKQSPPSNRADWNSCVASTLLSNTRDRGRC